MKETERIKVAISFCITLACSALSYFYLKEKMLHFFSNSSNFADFENNARMLQHIESHFQWLLFFQCFSILYMLIALPFLIPFLVKTLKLNSINWWKGLLVIEIVGLILAFTLCPPDVISKMIYLIIWQAPVLVNTVVMLSIIKKEK